jgi:hypothetical protein
MDAKSAIQIGLAVAVLLSFFATYLSAKTWHVAHVVLVFFVFLAAGVFWYLSAATMKAHKTYQEEHDRLKARAEQLAEMNDALRNGTTDARVLADLQADSITLSAGIDELAHQIHRMTLDRGRVWRDTQPEGVEADGAAQVSIEAPVPHQIAVGTVLFLFEQDTDDQAGRYLGEFEVTAAPEGSITLAPLLQMDQVSLTRLTKSPGPWALYEVMPIDRHDVFAGLEEAELKAMIPAASAVEYLRDGTEAEADDPAERVVGFKRDGTVAGPEEQDRVVERKYIRELRDYERLFRALNKQQFESINSRERLTRDKSLLDDALAKAKADVAFREEEKKRLAADLDYFQKELGLVTAHAQKIDALLKTIQSRVDALLAQNRQIAASIAKRQLEMAAEIERRTGTVPAAAANDLSTVAP